jgi:hypothetical protein
MRTLRVPRCFPLLALSFLGFGACQPDADVEFDGGEAIDPVVVHIDTTVAAVQEHLDSENYRENWSMWPEREALYSGAEPHGLLLTTYVNEIARVGLGALREGTLDVLPVGAVVVKENYMPDSTLDAITVMYKQAGYDPENNDWYWVKYLADRTVEASGRPESCIGCHVQAAENWDYLLTAQAQFGN